MLSIARHHAKRLEAREAELTELIGQLPVGSRGRREMMKVRRETRQMRDYYARKAAGQESPGSPDAA